MMIILYQIFESTDVATMLNKKELNYSTVTLCFIAILVSAEGEQTTPTGIAIVSLTSNWVRWDNSKLKNSSPDQVIT